jgi:nucleotide-binding universal stress UspA family protein
MAPMFEQILLPLDGSPLSARAIPYAIALAGAFACPVRLLRVTSTPYTPAEAQPLAVGLRHEAGAVERPAELASLEMLKEQFLAAEVPVTIGLESGDPAECILERAGGPVRTLVVMGTHGRTGITHWAMGSVTDHVVHAADVPVLALLPRNSEVAKPLQHILVTLDQSPLAEQALPYVEALARGLDLPLTLVRVHTPPTMLYGDPTAGGYYPVDDAFEADLERAAAHYLDRQAERLRRNGVRLEASLRHGAPAFEITCAAEENPGSLIVMATHGRSGVRRTRLGSVARRRGDARRARAGARPNRNAEPGRAPRDDGEPVRADRRR